MTLLAVAIPTWALEHTDVPRVVLAGLLAVNTVLAVLLQVPASRGTEAVPGAIRAMSRAGIALALCCVLLALTPDLPVALAVGSLVVAVVALTGAELWQSAGGWGSSYALAPPAHQGSTSGSWNRVTGWTSGRLRSWPPITSCGRA